MRVRVLSEWRTASGAWCVNAVLPDAGRLASADLIERSEALPFLRFSEAAKFLRQRFPCR